MLRLVNQLDPMSRTQRALRDMPEYARMVADSISDLGELSASTPSIANWGWQKEMTADVVDAIWGAACMLMAPHTKKGRPPHAPRTPRPVTEMDRALELREKVLSDQVRDRFSRELFGQ